MSGLTLESKIWKHIGYPKPDSILKSSGGIKKVSGSKQKAKESVKPAKKSLVQTDTKQGKAPALTKEVMPPVKGMQGRKLPEESKGKLAAKLIETPHKAHTHKVAKVPLAPQKQSRLADRVSKLRATLKIPMSQCSQPEAGKPPSGASGEQTHRAMDAEKRQDPVLGNLPKPSARNLHKFDAHQPKIFIFYSYS